LSKSLTGDVFLLTEPKTIENWCFFYMKYQNKVLKAESSSLPLKDLPSSQKFQRLGLKVSFKISKAKKRGKISRVLSEFGQPKTIALHESSRAS
jgi:hypothetical protein